jgi:predicted secreted Zn-dependent protease
MPLRFSPSGTVPSSVGRTFTEATLAGVAGNVANHDEAGGAEFEFEMSFDQNRNGLITRVDLVMQLTVELPVWQNRDSRPPPEQREWDRFLRALRVHEDGHLTIFRREAPTAYRRLQRARPQTIHEVLDAETERIQRLSDAYDHQTDHGRRQRTPHGTTVIQAPP